MIDLKKIQSIIQRTPEKKDYPKHVIINLFPIVTTEEQKKENFTKLLNLLMDIINVQIENNIPILTVSLGKKENILDQKDLKNFCETLLDKANQHKINITIFGRWYDLYGELVEALKKINNDTKDFDHFFFNLVINYDAKQEIADASRVIIRKILNEKLDVDSITPEIIKENIYSSNFIPPDLIIEPSYKFTGTFLWDSVNALIHPLNKPVLQITKADIVKALVWYASRS
jgi:undecaprenyl diphosphate synthase